MPSFVRSSTAAAIVVPARPGLSQRPAWAWPWNAGCCRLAYCNQRITREVQTMTLTYKTIGAAVCGAAVFMAAATLRAQKNFRKFFFAIMRRV